MITRIVKLSFRPESTTEFLSIFEAKKDALKQSEGCLNLQLFNHIGQKNTYFTISHWKSESDLERYRQSELFKEVWANVKPLFAEKAEAWSLQENSG